MNEIWKEIKNYEGHYKISSFGNVCSKVKQLKPFYNGKGYLYVNICKDGKRETIAVHRLVGLAFIDNPENKPQINHIDGIKTNNNVLNLEWVDNSENVKHAYENNLMVSIGLPVIQCTKDNVHIERFESISNASKFSGIGYMSIRKCCMKERKTAGGYIWKFA